MQLDPLALDDLPAYDDWPARLLGLDEDAPEWGGVGLDAYETEFGRLREVVDEHPEWTARDLALAGKRHARADPGPVSVGADLHLASPEDVQRLQDEALVAAVAPVMDDAETVVALGCGYGPELDVLAAAFPSHRLVGGEPTTGGRALADRLLPDRVAVEPFDFRDDRWDVLERGERVVVLTRGSLTALPSSRDAVATLAGHADAIAAGVHLEHVDGLHPTDSLLGLLRRAYTRERGYDADLLSALRESERVAVEATEYDVVGANPLHPLSTIRWRPRRESLKSDSTRTTGMRTRPGDPGETR